MNFVKTIHADTYPAIDPTNADLTGKSVFITGASKGIGLAAAISFAKAGASKIAIAARTPLESVEKQVLSAAKDAGRDVPEVVCLTVDVSNKESVASAAQQLKGSWKSLDVLINNAGYLETWLPIAQSDPDEWWKTWEININGTYLTTHYFLPLLTAALTSTIINVSSAGAHATHRGASAYQCTKLAICRFTEFLNEEYKDEGVTAMAVHPGGVDTELAKGMPEFMHGYLTDTPELVGDTFVWLSRGGREWLGGRYASVTWDVEELEGRKDEVLKGELLKVRMAVEI
ncbi:putative oxidoreductase [Tothia fuscella]|uniref:Oxidoreductase n=1 Tax=Tothia fuscella TaxID=1048955 RepID=A0A9P4P4B6_9PEZI|nr:putative oxidoreductase [Tothia fuscella]